MIWYAIIAVFLGSGLGGVCRYLLSKAIVEAFPQSEVAQWATLTVNVFGCFLLGLIYGLIESGCQMSDNLRLALTVGFCGGLTTFSTFACEGVVLLGAGQVLTALAYIVLSLILGLGAAACGYVLVVR